MILKDGVMLYHGSFQPVDAPDLARCRPHKDFGTGFYLTTDLEQAQKFAATSARKAIRRGELSPDVHCGYVSMYTFHSIGTLKIHEFQSADSEWLHCVVGHRRRGCFPDEVSHWAPYDALVGKIANDNTNTTITAYMDGVFGEMGSVTADRMVSSLLLPERLKNQICMRTVQAIHCLHFERSETVTW